MKKIGEPYTFRADRDEMQIWIDDSVQGKPVRAIEEATIEWEQDNGMDVSHIGVFFENGCLVDYDGVFELPKEAVKLLRANGFVVPRKFE